MSRASQYFALKLPDGLQNARWCCWNAVERDGKTTKVPDAKSNDPSTFTDCKTAFDRMQRQRCSGLGIGLFDGLCAIDVDHCVSGGELSPLAQNIVGQMGSYTELSPSGTGIHILFKVSGFQYDRERFYLKNPKNGVEVYVAGQTNRFMTFTGNAVGDCAKLEERGAELERVLEQYMVREAKTQQSARHALSALNLSDVELLQKAASAKNGAKFSALWAGDWRLYNSQSEADAALCSMLAFWAGGDAARVDALFRQSGLMRDKWNERRGAQTYGEMTVAGAVALCSEFHRVPQREQASEIVSLKPPDFSDAGNCEIFVREYRYELVHTAALGWFHWTGKVWAQDDNAAMRLALELSERMLAEAGQKNRDALASVAKAQAEFDEDKTPETEAALDAAQSAAKKEKVFLEWAQCSRNERRLKAMIALAIPALSRRADELDANAFDLNTPEGIADLRTGRMRPHDPAALCTKMTAAAPSTEGAERWQEFLNTVTGGDRELQRFLQIAIGSSLIGKVYHEGIFMAIGGGRNGKSTCFNAVAAVVGEYAGTVDVRLLTKDKTNKGAALATLRGRRLVLTGELEQNHSLSVSTLKALASTDRLTVERKYHDPETITPSHTLFLFTNFLPQVTSTDEGTWRRLTVIPFNVTIPLEGAKMNYADALAREAGGAILRWAIDGAVAFYKGGCKLPTCRAVAAACDGYKSAENWLANFIADCCTIGAGERASAGSLYQTYRNWAVQNGEQTHTTREFHAAMESAGYQQRTLHGCKVWNGLRVAPLLATVG